MDKQVDNAYCNLRWHRFWKKVLLVLDTVEIMMKTVS